MLETARQLAPEQIQQLKIVLETLKTEKPIFHDPTQTCDSSFPETINHAIQQKKEAAPCTFTHNDAMQVNCLEYALKMLDTNLAIINDKWEGKTALHIALLEGNAEVADYLFKKGASLSITDYNTWFRYLHLKHAANPSVQKSIDNLVFYGLSRYIKFRRNLSSLPCNSPVISNLLLESLSSGKLSCNFFSLD